MKSTITCITHRFSESALREIKGLLVQVSKIGPYAKCELDVNQSVKFTIETDYGTFLTTFERIV